MSSYCDPSDLYSYGLQRGALPNPGRYSDGIDVASDALALGEHGFATDDPVAFRAEAGGALPAPLAEGVTYYAQPLDPDRFGVSVLPAGAPIDLTSAGSGGIVVIAPIPIAACISWASALVEDLLPAHIVPLAEPYPEIIRATVAELAAGKALSRTGAASRSMSEIVDFAQKRLARWSKGIPLRGAVVPPHANLAAATGAASDPRGWGRWGGL